LDNVLGEVSRVFGTGAGQAAPLASLAEDTINEHLSDLAAPAEPKSPDRAEPKKQEAGLENGADLFRTSPEAEETEAVEPQPELNQPAQVATFQATIEQPVAQSVEGPSGGAAAPQKEQANSEAPPPAEPASTKPRISAPASAPPSKVATLAPRALAARAKGATANVRSTSQQVGQRLPHRAKFALALAAAVLIGWIGRSLFTRSSTAAEKASVGETPQATPEEIAEDKSKIATLEEQLAKSQHEREVATHERDQVRQRLDQSNTLLRTEQQSIAAQRARDEATRKQAIEVVRQAEEHGHLLELRAYDSQLARVRDCWQRTPGLAADLLEDPRKCPPKLRDFTWGYFYGRSRNDRATWRGTAPANTVAWSPDGTLVASAGQDGSIALRDAASGKQLAALPAHAGGVNALAFSPRGDWLASAGADSTVKLWNVASRRLEATFFGHLGSVLSVAVAPDSSALVSGGDDGTVRFWDVASRSAVATRWGHPRNREPDDANDPSRFVRAVAFSPDGRLIASGGYQVVRVWGADAVERTTIGVSEGGVSALAFSPESRTLAIGTERSISVRDVDSLLVRSGPWNVDAPVNALAFSADGGWLGAAAGEQALIFARTIRPSANERQEPAVNFAAGSLARYILAAPRRLAGHDGSVTGVSFAPNGQVLATSGADGTVRLWDPRGGLVDKTQPDVVLRDVPDATALAYSPDSHCLAIGTSDGIRLWDTRAGVEMARLENRSGDLRRLAFSPDGSHLASAGRDWTILIWTLRDQRVELALNGHRAGVNTIGYAADGKTLVSASDDGTVRLWNAVTGQQVASLTGHAGAVLSATLSPDGKIVASGGADQKIRLWSVERKQTSATLAGHDGPVVALAFSPDGRFLVSAGGHSSSSPGAMSTTARRPLRLWKIPDGRELLAFGQADADILDVAFSPDSKTVAASGTRGITVWDPRTGELRTALRPLSASTDPLQGASGAPRRALPIAFSPDGKSLAAGGDAALCVWTAAPFAPALAEKTGSAP
jgi:WD40 repeat protein